MTRAPSLCSWSGTRPSSPAAAFQVGCGSIAEVQHRRQGFFVLTPPLVLGPFADPALGHTWFPARVWLGELANQLAPSFQARASPGLP